MIVTRVKTLKKNIVVSTGYLFTVVARRVTVTTGRMVMYKIKKPFTSLQTQKGVCYQ